MSVTIEFDGYFRRCFRKVLPQNISIRGKQFYIHGIPIPIAESRLYDVFFYLEKECGYKNGKVKLVLLHSGDIQYASSTTDDSIDFFLTSVFGPGATYYYLPKRIETIPSDDDYLVGQYHYHL